MIDFEAIDAIMDVVEMILLPLMFILFIRMWIILEGLKNEKKA